MIINVEKKLIEYIEALEQENKQLKEVINKARNNIIKDIAMIKKQYVEKPEIIMRLEQTIKILGEKNE